ncbi:MAG: hypothetical protein IKW59_03445 [Clostridia bacterium]|nr:hypothetical protein [Clostridia bacterium]
MSKKAYFYIDDVIWPYRDITREKPASIFDHHLLKMLKEAHDRYGFKVVLNSFYRTDYFYGDDEFTLADMTDAYKEEWEAASDWLKIGFHAKQEFPDYPHVNADYEDMKNLYERFKKEVIRFAGEKVLSTACNPHWLPISKEGICALRDCGIKMVSVSTGDRQEYNGDESSLPYGHAFRLLNNRKPETMVFGRNSRNEAIKYSICGYNHMSEEETKKIRFTKDVVFDEETGIYFKKFWNGVCLNLTPLEEIEADMAKSLEHDYSFSATHEQYAYPDYFAYQPETRDKLFKMCEIYEKNGYEYIFIEDLIEE